MKLPDKGYYGQPFRSRAVCRSCRLIMSDIEPNGGSEFWHPINPKHPCPNGGKTFHLPRDIRYVEPFLRKKDRRRNKRLKVRAKEPNL